ncbi:ABC transporter ATP-binding protein [Arthrobacter sp. Hiyo1]|nr:ABC transporter ATP-binding protein [Arthrobacter sp. Hiyo1]
MISHDVELLEATVNKVYHLDANRAQIDFYNMGWKRYLQQRETDERARKRERANAEKKAQVLMDQANKMRAKPPRPWPRRTWRSVPNGCLAAWKQSARMTAWQPCVSRILLRAARLRSRQRV